MEEEIEVTVDGATFRVADLSPEAQAQVTNLKFVDAEIVKLNAQLAVYTTARMAYENALRAAVPRSIQ